MAVVLTASAAGACDRVLKLDDIHPIGGDSGGGSGTIDGPPVPPPCTPSMSFANVQAYQLFEGLPSSALTLSLDETIFVVEDPTVSVLYRREAGTNTNIAIAAPNNDLLAEPTMDPEASVLYARDKTAGNVIIAFERINDVFQPATNVDVPSGKRAGNQTLDLGGFRRMMTQFDPGNGVFVFDEYQGSPTTGWTLYGTQYSAMDLTGNSTNTIEDPALTADGLNLTFTSNGDAYYSHRGAVSDRFTTSTLLRTGPFSTPVLSSNCRDLYVVDKNTHEGDRFMIP